MKLDLEIDKIKQFLYEIAHIVSKLDAEPLAGSF